LAHENRQRDSVHISVADRLGEKLGDEAQPRDARKDANSTRDDGHHSGESDRVICVSSGERGHDTQNNRRQRGVRPKHQDAARAEQRVNEQGDDGRIEATGAGEAGGDSVCDSDGRKRGREHQPRTEIANEPTRVIPSQRSDSW